MTLYSGGQSLLGKRVSSLVGNDLKVLADGSVVGTIKKVTGYTQFSSKKEERNDNDTEKEWSRRRRERRYGV